MRIRMAEAADVEAICALCAEHAAYERAVVDRTGLAARLREALFGAHPRAWCAVADDSRTLAGYATWSREFSTWHGREYVHLDCLYVVAALRNRGIGAQLLHLAGDAAAASGCPFVEWQTPEWNAGAIRFYERHGAAGSRKVRFRWIPPR
jgi:GNAT superfamily N-acetyltransferase